MYIHTRKNMCIHIYRSNLSIYLASCLSVCLPACLSVCLSFYVYIYRHMSKYDIIDIYIYIHDIIYTYTHTLWDNPFFRGRTGRQVWVSNAVVLGGWLVSLTSLAGLARDFDLMLCQGQLFQTTLKTTFTELVPVAVGRGIH